MGAKKGKGKKGKKGKKKGGLDHDADPMETNWKL